MAEPGLRPKEANAIVCRCPLTLTRFVLGESTGSKPLRDLKGYPVLQHRWRWVGGGVGLRGGSASPSLLCSNTHSDKHTRSHASLLPAINAPPNLTHLCPHSWVDPAALSVIAPLLHDHTELRHRGRAAAAQANFQAVQPRRIQGPKARGLHKSHLQRSDQEGNRFVLFFKRCLHSGILWNQMAATKVSREA